MGYSFDNWGWFREVDIPGRQTDIAPPDLADIPPGHHPNFTGYAWILLPYVEPPPPDPHAKAYAIGHQIAVYLDEKTRERGYDDMKSACTYALSAVPKFRLEGQACLDWRDAVWVKVDAIQQEVAAGLRPVPTYEQVLAELPELTWPAV